MYLKQLIGFFVRASGDHRIGPHHVAVYMAIFQEWCIQECANPITVFKEQVSKVSKVGKTTYYKCMQELHEYGYIEYTPSYSPFLGSLVRLVEMDM